jgi:hypothetical protein
VAVQRHRFQLVERASSILLFLLSDGRCRCGSGTWLAAAQELGATQLMGIDGHWSRSANPFRPGLNIQILDLERPIEIMCHFDLPSVSRSPNTWLPLGQKLWWPIFAAYLRPLCLARPFLSRPASTTSIVGGKVTGASFFPVTDAFRWTSSVPRYGVGRMWLGGTSRTRCSI